MRVEINPEEREQIRRWGRGLDHDITLRYAASGHAMDDRFKAFVDQMADVAPRVRGKRDGETTVSLPALFVDGQVTYQALPLDRELEPFLSVLHDQRTFVNRVDPAVRQRLVQLLAPALIKVYITSHCPFCPTVVTTLLGLVGCSDRIRLTVIDGELFPQAARDDRVHAAPTVIIDDKFRWTGSVDAGELVTLMLDRDPASLGADALRGMIEAANASGLAKMMADRGKIFPAFIDLLIHPRWSVRLGAMVSFETLVELDPGLAGGIVDPVRAVFDEVDDMVKGDLLHVIGESGNRAAIPFLEKVAAADGDDEVHAAAVEAIDKLK